VLDLLKPARDKFLAQIALLKIEQTLNKKDKPGLAEVLETVFPGYRD
jgi:hypothetical protein